MYVIALLTEQKDYGSRYLECIDNVQFAIQTFGSRMSESFPIPDIELLVRTVVKPI
jgi:hypothetical protein